MSIKSYINVNKIQLIISTLLGLVAGSLIMYISWQHNSQCEIHCEGIVHWGYWFTLGLFAFAPIFIAALVLALAFNYVKNT